MPRRRSIPVVSMDPLGWFRVATHTAEMMQASAYVIAQRTTVMGTMGLSPSTADRRELRTMVQEKSDAVMESATAMAWKASRVYGVTPMDLAQRMAMSYATLWGWPYSSAKALAPLKGSRTAAAAIVNAGLEPYRRRSKKNAARLMKRPSRK
jgi:hypothetical protein